MSNNLSQWILLLGLLVSLSLASHHHYHHHKRHHHHHHAHHRSNVTKGAQRPSSYPDDEHSLRNIQMQDLIEDDDEFFNKLKKEKAMVIPTVLSDAGPKAANMADLEIEHLAEQIPEFKDKTVAKYFKKSYREGDIESTEDFKAIISGNLSPQDLEELRKKLKWQVTKDEHGKPMVKIPFLVRNLGKQAIESINQAIEDLKRFTCIRLTPREKEDKDYVQFLPSKKGCTSHFGRQTGAQRIGLGAGCEYKGTVLHEVMHTLGFLHECTRPDRNRYIRVNFDKVEEGRKRNFKTYDHKIIADYDGQYDPFSIMHCNHHAFNEDREDETIESLLPNIPNKILGQRFGLTALDVMKINQAYCRTTPEVIVQPSLQLQQPPPIVLDIPQRDEMASTTTTTTTTPPTTTSTSTTTTTLTTTTPTTTTSTSTSTTPTTTTTTTTPFFIPPILLPLLFPTTTTTTSTTTTLVPGQEIEDDPIDPNSDDPVTTTTTAEPLSELDQATTTTTETPRIVIQFPLLTSCIPNPLCVTPPCNAQPCLQQPSPPQPQVVQPSQPSDESCDKPPCETKDSECNSPYPCWPQNFEWSNVGFPQSCDCHNNNPSSSAPPPGPPISIIPDNAPENDKKCHLCRCTPMKSTQTPRVWSNNHFCHPSTKKDPKFQLLRSGFVPGKRCLLIDESKEWDNLHLCFDKAAPYDLMWSTVDQLKENGKSRCLKMEEPQDWVWNKKYLCDKNSV